VDFEPEKDAWDLLKAAGYKEHRFEIAPIGRAPTEKEYLAIWYLCDEWDWAWGGYSDGQD
jgi:hypothetical protein